MFATCKLQARLKSKKSRQLKKDSKQHHITCMVKTSSS